MEKGQRAFCPYVFIGVLYPCDLGAEGLFEPPNLITVRDRYADFQCGKIYSEERNEIS